MSRKHRRHTPASAEQLARSAPSPVAVAAFARGGAGTHGKTGGPRHRAERADVKRNLRNWRDE